jgi:hypothetical protein
VVAAIGCLLAGVVVVDRADAAAKPLRYGWEDELQGWKGENSTVSVDGARRRNGSGSMMLTRSVGPGWASLRAHDGHADVRDLSAGGRKLRAFAWVPKDSPGEQWMVRLQVQDQHWNWHLGPAVTMRPGRWTKVVYELAPELASAARRVGVQFEVTGADGTVEPRLDSFRQSGKAAASPTPTSAPQPTAPPPTTASTTTTTNAPPPAQPSTGPVVGDDALQRRTLSQQQSFVDWLARGDAKGYVGEVGWPNDESVDRWNALAAKWYEAADEADLWVTAWATGEWWGPYTMAHYRVSGGGSLNAATPTAAVLEAHRGNGADRGVNLNGGEFGIGPNLGTGSGGAFSNVNRGTYDQSYHYDSQASMDYLASRGVGLVRLPFRWERIQPAPGGDLDQQELARLRAAIDRAGKAGLQVVPTVMNYGAYWLHNPSTGRGDRTPIGSPEVSQAHFADLWRRLATALGDQGSIGGWGLMNEPCQMPGGAPAWERASQAAVDAIRSSGDARTILVPGYSWSTISKFATEHPKGPWVTDPAENLRYEAHHYFDGNLSGDYRSYDAELSDAVQGGH